MPFQDAHTCLNRLIESRMVEYDERWHVLRFTQLPDAGEWPFNPDMLITWWGRFDKIPACAVRDAYVVTLRKLLVDGASAARKRKRTSEPVVKPAHEEIWNQTFGTIRIPVSHLTGSRVVPNEDTSTPSQPSLFASKPLESTSMEVSIPGAKIDPSGSSYCQATWGSISGVGEGVFSSSPDSDPSGAILPGDHVREAPSRPRLALVPPPTDTVAVQAMLAALARESGGGFKPDVREGLETALQRALDAIPEIARGSPEIALVGAAIARAPAMITQQPGDPHSKLSAWLAGQKAGGTVTALTR